MLIGRSVAGIQAGDISRVVNFLKGRKDVAPGKIGAVALDEICPSLIHAAAFNESINSILLFGAPLSYRSLVMNKFYNQDFTTYSVAGALTAYDLPDLLACLAPRKIVLMELKDEMKQSAANELIEAELKFPRAVYSSKNVSGNLKILTSSDDLGSIINWCFENQ
jgi:hypothetical protein